MPSRLRNQVLGLLALTAAAVGWAQDKRPDPWACVAPVPTIVPSPPHLVDDRAAFVRVAMRIDDVAAEPRIEVLARSATDAQLEAALAQLRTYRLKCRSGNAWLSMVYEQFLAPGFAGASAFRWIAPDDGRPAACKKVTGMEPPAVDWRHVTGVSKYELELSFDGPAGTPPKARILASLNPNEQIERDLFDQVARYRSPCDFTPEAPMVVSQPILIEGPRQFRLRRDEISLTELASWLEPASVTGIGFDLDSMNCPFDVSMQLAAPPEWRHSVGSSGKPTIQRSALLRWLSEVRLTAVNDRARADLVGQRIRVRVPCGQFKLEPPAERSVER